MLDHEGLQRVPQYSDLELYSKRSSYSDKHYAPIVAVTPINPATPSLIPPEHRNDIQAEHCAGEKRQAKRLCGLPRRCCIILSASILICVIIAVVIAVLVAVSQGHHSNGSADTGSNSSSNHTGLVSNNTSNVNALSIASLSGLALLARNPVSKQSYGCYQDIQGNIREAILQNSSWIDASGTPSVIVNGTIARDGTLLAATTYVSSNVLTVSARVISLHGFETHQYPEAAFLPQRCWSSHDDQQD
jgi:hypothetical protein